MNIRDKPKTVWDVVNKITGRQKPHAIVITSAQIVNRRDIANAMKKHFIEAGAHPSLTRQNDGCVVTPVTRVSGSILLKIVTAAEVPTVIKKIMSTVTPGVDEIIPSQSNILSAESLMCCLELLAISSGTFPAKLKLARVTPV